MKQIVYSALGTLEHLPDILQLVNYTLPFAIVQRGLVVPETLPEKCEDKFLFESVPSSLGLFDYTLLLINTQDL